MKVVDYIKVFFLSYLKNCLLHIPIMGGIIMLATPPDGWQYIPLVIPFSIIFWAPVTTIVLFIGSLVTKNISWSKSYLLISISIILFDLICSFPAHYLLEYLDKNGLIPKCFYYFNGSCDRLGDFFSVYFEYTVSGILLFLSIIIINKTCLTKFTKDRKSI